MKSFFFCTWLYHIMNSYQCNNGHTVVWFQVFLSNSNMYIYLPILSVRVGLDIRSIFKRTITGLNSEFSFSHTSCLITVKETKSVLVFTHYWENFWVHIFPAGISDMTNRNNWFDYIVSSNYSYLIITLRLFTVIWFQVTNNL